MFLRDLIRPSFLRDNPMARPMVIHQDSIGASCPRTASWGKRVCRADAFTLVELLVVIAIIGGMMALLMPAVQAAREAARKLSCQNNLRQVGLAVHVHDTTYRKFPIGCIGCRYQAPPPGQPFIRQRYLSWNIQILPFIEQSALYASFNLTVPSYSEPNRTAGASVLPFFLCPSTPSDKTVSTSGTWRGLAYTDYCGIYGVEGVGRDAGPGSEQYLNDESLGVLLYENSVAPNEITDGLSNTVLIAETKLRRQTENEWANGHNLFAQEQSTPVNAASGLGNDIGSPHHGGAFGVFCDGHIRFLSDSLDQHILIALLTKSGGEPIGEF